MNLRNILVLLRKELAEQRQKFHDCLCDCDACHPLTAGHIAVW